MTLRSRSVTALRLPGKLDGKMEKRLFSELESSMNVERPAIVLDCSAMREIDSRAVFFLLCCLEGAMKRNGDVRLSGLTPKVRLSMELAGVDRLFRVFATTHEAVESFQRRPAVVPAYALQFAEERAA